jgi:ABC-2 type transport system permease protein
MKHYLKILLTLFKFSQVNFLEYRADFFLTWLGDVLAVSFTVLLFGVIYSHVNSIAGWAKGEIYLLLAVSSYLEALIYFLYTDSIRSVSELLPTGDLDYFLTRPVDFQFLITFSRISPNTLGPLVPAVILTVLGLNLLRPEHLLLKLAGYFYLIILGIMVHYSLILLITSFSFLTIRFDGIMHLDGRLRNLANNPMSIFPKPLKLIFYTLLPIVFFSHLPVEMFRSQPIYLILVYATAMAIFSLFLSRKIFFLCLRHYSSASS